MSTLKWLAFYLAIAAFIAAVFGSTRWFNSTALEPEDPLNTAKVIWAPAAEETRHDWAPGSEPGDYSAFDESMRSSPVYQP